MKKSQLLWVFFRKFSVVHKMSKFGAVKVQVPEGLEQLLYNLSREVRFEKCVI